jgi:hypothetical protein
MVDGIDCVKQAYCWSNSDDPSHRVRSPVDCDDAEQRAQYRQELMQPEKELEFSEALDLFLRIRAHGYSIEVAAWKNQMLIIVRSRSQLSKGMTH